MWIIVSHYNDPQQPTSIVQSKARFFSWLTWKASCHIYFIKFLFTRSPTFQLSRSSCRQKKKKTTVKYIPHVGPRWKHVIVLSSTCQTFETPACCVFFGCFIRKIVLISGQSSIIPKPECFGDFGEVPLLFTTI